MLPGYAELPMMSAMRTSLGACAVALKVSKPVADRATQTRRWDHLGNALNNFMMRTP
jgi:hypothetical protein